MSKKSSKPQREEPARESKPQAEEVELRIEELEERIAPRLAANHNEVLLVDL